MSQQKSYAAALRRDDGGAAAAVCWDGLGPSCSGGDDGRMSMDAVLNLFCVFFSPLSYWDIVLIYPVQRSLAGKTDTPFFFFGGGLMESRFN